MKKTLSFLTTVLASVTVLGCSSLPSVTDLGNSILSMTGFLPAKSATDFATGLIEATKDLTNEEEYYFGRAISAKLLTQYTLLENNDLRAYLTKVGKTVAINSPQPETFGGYQFSILNTDKPLALSTPGGFIFVSHGLLERLPDEDTLAAVLAHEVAHVVEKHGVKALSQDNIRETVSAAGKLVSSMSCGEILTSATAVFGGVVDDYLLTALERGYGRDQEREADMKAIDILAISGYDPKALGEALQILDHSADSDGGWMSSHPLTSERTAALESEENKFLASSSSNRSLRASRYAMRK